MIDLVLIPHCLLISAGCTRLEPCLLKIRHKFEPCHEFVLLKDALVLASGMVATRGLKVKYCTRAVLTKYLSTASLPSLWSGSSGWRTWASILYPTRVLLCAADTLQSPALKKSQIKQDIEGRNPVDGPKNVRATMPLSLVIDT